MATPGPTSPEITRTIYSVSQLNREARALLEGAFPLLWVEGEISNLARPRSGHIYFSLKDDSAQVRCAMFRNRNMYLPFQPKDGSQVLCRARISLYEARGDYQLIVESMEEAGDGALKRAFEALKQRLDREGLFDAAHKLPLPELPRRIGVITSPTGAAIRDVLNVLARRFPAIEILIYPVPVQGPGAGDEIARTIRAASERNEVDVLLVTRGGGSLEDLWAFNEEVVARALYDCPLPVVSAVGHEIDFTIADFVADQRAPTPSAAAEMLSPDRSTLLNAVAAARQRLVTITRRELGLAGQRLSWLSTRLNQQHPGRRLQDRAQRLDELEQRLGRAMENNLRQRRTHLAHLDARLKQRNPAHALALAAERLDKARTHLLDAMGRQLESRTERLRGLARALDAVSPLATLHRGYGIVSDEDGSLLRNADAVKPGARIRARLAQGSLKCRVEETLQDTLEDPTP